MDYLMTALSEHGYSILVGVVFLEAIGFPVPAAIALLIAGAASAGHSLNTGIALSAALLSVAGADTLMFLLGRHTGWWLLGVLCRLSLNPESCMMQSAAAFYKRGRTLLLFAKFVPGINTMAPPMAGSMNMRLGQFLSRDLIGVVLYVGAYFGIGYLFSGVLASLLKGYQAVGQVVSWILGLAIIAYICIHFVMWRKSLKKRFRLYVKPAEAHRAWEAGNAVIYDVRSHGYYDAKAMRIKGSTRLEPNALHQSRDDFPAGKFIYLYCTCIRDATSARVAQLLREQGVISAVIEGGFRAWRKAGLPLEPVPLEEVSALPVFDS